MDPITLALLSGVPGVIEGGIGMWQGMKTIKEAEAIREAAGDRPEYEIPKSIQEYVDLYKGMDVTGLPGEDIYRQEIGGRQAQTATAAGQVASTEAGALSALGQAHQQSLSSLRDLSIRSSMYRQQQENLKRQGVAGALQTQANYQDKEWQYNQFLPWQTAQNEYWGLRQSGQAMMMGGIDTAGSTMTNALGSAATMRMYQDMMPDTTTHQTQAPWAYPWGNYNPNPTQYTMQPYMAPSTPADTQAQQYLYGNTYSAPQGNNWTWNPNQD